MKYLVLLCLLLAVPAFAASEDSRRAKDILSKPEYRGYRVEEPQPAEVERTESSASENSSNGGSEGSGSKSNPPRRSASGRTDAMPNRPRGGGGGGGGRGGMGTLGAGVLQAIFWIFVAIVVIFALFFIVRWIMDRKPRPKPAKAEIIESAQPVTEEALPAKPRGFPELEAQLAAALKAGDFALAAVLRYKLFWLNAGWRAVTDEQEPKTWRDALKLVRSDDLRREVRRLLALVESVRYGKHKPDAEEFNSWNAKLEGIDHRTLLT